MTPQTSTRAVVVSLVLLAAGPAVAAPPEFLDPFARAEVGVAFPLNSPQTTFFNPGFGGRLNLGLFLGPWFGVQLTAQMLALPAKSAAPSQDPSVPVGLGGGLRFKFPYRYKVSPWVDADAMYVRTGGLDRFGWDLGLGVHWPIGARKIVRLGPFARFFMVIDNKQFQFDSTASSNLIVGLSVEVGAAQKATVADRDHDGVADADDRCPDRAGPASRGGCPDSDGDGLVDSADKCPDQAGPAATAGCPDQDGDGVADAKDACPAQAGSAKAGGCPDADGDGVADGADKCPSVAGPAAGCPDADGDGVADADDQCPAEAGPASRKGCPLPKVTVTAKKIEIDEKIYFDTALTTIQERSLPVLDLVVKELAENPALRLRIEGHTDSKGVAGKNKKLSQGRADAVKAYLVDKGVAAARVEARGFGQARPIADNKTDAGREKNRRVEFVVLK